MALRVDQPRDLSLSKRTDMIEDIIDVLKSIKAADGYKTTPKNVVPWQISSFADKELPAITVFDEESEEEDNSSRVKHNLVINIEYITGNGVATSNELRSGAEDVLKAIGSIEERFCRKYETVELLKFQSVSMGMEKASKTYGGLDIAIGCKYLTPRWQL